MNVLIELIPILFFFAAYKLWGIYAATGAAIVASLLQLAWTYHRTRTLDKVQIGVAGMILVFGGATLLLQDPTFIKLKPTAVYLLLALVFLGSLLTKTNLIEAMMGRAEIKLPPHASRRLCWVWGGFFVTMAGANLFVAFNYPEEVWVDFKVFGMTGLTLVFAVAQAFYVARHTQEEPESQGS
ncbi:MAG: septation protein A [Alphaproteobacteria bacterium CG_4_10_14_0_2_um_filter_63_37]|nr:MAG: hypothetical protein AUJ55_06340 [Proteobacteria bacterium CG1_02_64_396]PJA24381.1 MAG: septation protein A [Alphaproteobacteria bacterium CG_4_10_14_0_2_um_filter_63_37]